MSPRAEASSRKQSRRVAAWIYAVINPIIESLFREQAFLEVGNLTWRPYSGRCEMIRNIQDYVDTSQWPNYQTFLAEYPKSVFPPGFREHDNKINDLNKVAQELFRTMLSPGQFLRSLNASLDAFQSLRSEFGTPGQSPSDSSDVLREEVAQHVINNSQTLPSHYVISKFWNTEGRNLLEFRNRAEFLPLQRNVEGLLENSRKLRKALESFRLALSRDYDVPAAPVPGLAFED